MTIIWGPGPTEYRFFWSSEVRHFDSEEEAQAFVQRLSDDPWVMTGFRRLLDPSGTTFEDDKDALIELAARLLIGGELIADLNTTDSFEPMWQYFALFRDRHFTHNFLSRFRRDPLAMAGLRSLLREAHLGANVSLHTADRVFTEIATLLATNRLIPGFRVHAGAGAFSGDEVQGFPLRASTGTPSPLPSDTAATGDDESPTLPDNDAAAQAAALRAAAATGVPFCEECAKAAAAAAGPASSPQAQS